MQEHDLRELEELTEEKLGFSALSDGLGFSQQKKRQPETPKETASKISVSPPPPAPISTPTTSAAPAGAVAAGPASPVIHAPKIVFKKATSETAPVPVNAPSAPLTHRFSAFVLDLVLAFGPWALVIYYVFPAQSRIDILASGTLLGLSCAYFLTYLLLSEGLGGQSPGKMVWSLQVVEDDKYQKPIGLRTALARIALFTLTLATAGLALVVAFRDSKGRALHDKVTGTIVRKQQKI